MEAERRLRRAALAGGASALAIAAWLLANPAGGLFARRPLGDFFDAQAHSLLHGHWDVPGRVMKVEAFVVHGKSYMYFGPVPALFRLPVALVTHRLDGRLTAPSILVGLGVALWAATRLHLRVRRWVRPDTPVSRGEWWAVAGLTFVIGAGSALGWLAGSAVVYHEALVWGVALSLLGLDAVLAWHETPSTRRLLDASVLAALALNTRASVGAGPLAALALVAVGPMLRRQRPRLRAAARALAPVGIACVLVVASYAYVNHAKFGSWFGVPFDKQRVTAIDQHRRDVLADNGGTIFGIQFVPTTVLHYARPDGLRLQSLFPWINVPARAHIVGDVNFDYVDRSGSVPAAMPLLTVLALVGAWAVIRERKLRPLALPALGALAGAGVTLTIGFIAHRYLADAVPLLVLLSVGGLQWLLRRRAGRWVYAVLGGLAALSVWITVALAVLFQHQYGIGVAATDRAAFVRFQRVDAPAVGHAPAVLHGDHLPAPAADGTLFVAGSCDALYQSDGRAWSPVARTAAGGEHRLDVTFPGHAAGAEALVAGVRVRYLAPGRVTFAYGSTVGDAWRLTPGRRYRLTVVVDHRLGFVQVRHGDRVLLDAFILGDAAAPPAPFSGTVHERPFDASVCRAVTR